MINLISEPPQKTFAKFILNEICRLLKFFILYRCGSNFKTLLEGEIFLKKLVLLATFTMVMFVTGSALANVPNTNYDKAGKGAVGMSISRSDVETNVIDFGSVSYDKHWNFGAKAEVVVAPKWSVGFNYMYSKSAETTFENIRFGGDNKIEASLITFELTAQYMAYQKDGFSVIPYVGWASDKGKIRPVNVGESVSETKNDFLLGSKFVYDFNKHFTAYADLGFGNDIVKWGVGVAYKFTPAVALSVGYDYRKVNKFNIGSRKMDGKAKNIVIGLTYLF